MGESIFDDVRIFLPKYLSDGDQKKLFSELKSFPKNIDKRFFTLLLKDEKNLFQGDGFSSIIMADYDEKEFIEVKCILLSNTCDITVENKRNHYSPFMLFSPIFKLEEYKKALMEENSSNIGAIENHIESIRKQEVSSIFYLPPFHNNEDEFFVRFDCTFSIPQDMYPVQKLLDERLFTLSDYGFYLFLLKISIHFSRIQESIKRGS